MLSVLAEGGGRVLRISRSNDISEKFFISNLSNKSSRKSIASANENNSNTNDVDSNNNVNNTEDEFNTESVRSFGLSFSLTSFGLSLVVEKPIRREFLSLYVDGLEGRLKTKGHVRSFEFMVMDLQVDNYSETVVYPVLLHSTKKEVHKNVDLFREDESEDGYSNSEIGNVC